LHPKALVLVLVSVTLLTVPIPCFASSPKGFVVYSVTYSSVGNSGSFVVNETVAPGSTSGFDDFLLRVTSISTNFTVSKVINSSIANFPYVPAITNQTFTFERNSTTVSASVLQTGSSSVDFGGSSYSLTVYTANLALSSPKGGFASSSTVKAFPSGLLYSVVGTIGKSTSFAVVLLATSLSLQGPAASSTAQAVSVAVGGTAVAGMVALTYGFGIRKKSKPETRERPDYWVD